MDSKIVIVSGLPRSGTSLLMQMLDTGGLEILTDNVRVADLDNPRGYYELEKVKSVKRNSSWLRQARGKAFKMVSLLLYDLPPGEEYQIIFMERDMDEVLLSQRKMLTRLNRKPGDDGEMKRFFALHLEKLRDWLCRQSHIDVLYVSYNDLLAQPMAEAKRSTVFWVKSWMRREWPTWLTHLCTETERRNDAVMKPAR